MIHRKFMSVALIATLMTAPLYASASSESGAGDMYAEALNLYKLRKMECKEVLEEDYKIKETIQSPLKSVQQTAELLRTALQDETIKFGLAQYEFWIKKLSAEPQDLRAYGRLTSLFDKIKSGSLTQFRVDLKALSPAALIKERLGFALNYDGTENFLWRTISDDMRRTSLSSDSQPCAYFTFMLNMDIASHEGTPEVLKNFHNRTKKFADMVPNNAAFDAQMIPLVYYECLLALIKWINLQ